MRLMLVSVLVVSAIPLPLRAAVTAETSLEVALGKHGREQLARQLAQRKYGDRTFEWKDYAAWGRELLVKGSVEKPPVGAAPSARLSKSYRCAHCHNLVREDRSLVRPSPEVREELVRSSPPEKAERRDGTTVSLLPGTTMWGVVNRSRYYNEYYAKYATLKTADGTVMNPERLSDALQVCSRYCSAGRFPEPWELDSLLAALWDLEVKLKDLDLPAESLQKITAALSGEDQKAIEEARGLLGAAFPKAAKATLHEKVKDIKGDTDVYSDRSEKGDPKRGEVVFQASCGGCHGSDVDAPKPAKIARRAKADSSFHRPPTRGTDRLGGLYMPLFTVERLSTRQLADVRVYLASTGGS